MSAVSIPRGRNTAGKARDFRIREAAKHAIVAIMPNAAIQKKFDLTAEGARAAQYLAEKNARASGAWAKIERTAERDRIITTVRRIAERHPKLLTRVLVRGDRAVEVAQSYGVSKARVYQMVEAVEAVAALLRLKTTEVAVLAEKNRLPATAAAEFDKIPEIKRDPTGR